MRWRRSPLPALVGVLALGTVTCGIREDELRCEEAVAHLADCCPGFDAEAVDCYYVETGCGNVYPALEIDESRCIARLSCAELVDSGICSRAQAAQPNDGAEVCP